MVYLRVLVRFAFFVALVSGCASGSVAPAQQPSSAPTAAPTSPAQLVAEAPAGSGSPTPDATAQEEGARPALSLPAGTALPPIPAPESPVARSQPQSTAPSPKPAAAAPLTLEDEIFLAGAPMFAIMFVCDALGPDIDLPAVTWQQAEGMGQLCLYGFADEEEIAYEIYDSEGAAVDAGVVTATTLDSPQPAAAILLPIEAYPSGQWSVKASSSTVTMQESFEVAEPEGPPRVAMRLSPGAEATKEERGLADLHGGDEVFIDAIRLPPDTEIAVGVYYTEEQAFTESALSLHEQATMLSDEAGTLSVRLQLDPSYTPGFYCVVVAATEGYQPAYGSGEGGATECFTVAPQ